MRVGEQTFEQYDKDIKRQSKSLETVPIMLHCTIFTTQCHINVSYIIFNSMHCILYHYICLARYLISLREFAVYTSPFCVKNASAS
jgi:hypothetical protein